MLNTNSKKIYKNLLFDADGTLLDFGAVEKRAIEKTFAKYNIPLEYVNYYKKHNHLLWEGLEDNIIDPDFILYRRYDFIMSLLNRREESDEVVAYYNSIISSGDDLFKDTEAVINELHSRGYNIIIITNGLSQIQHSRFSTISFTPLISKLCISGELGASKPDSRFFEKTFDICNLITKDNCIVIGDRLSSDILGAQNYGLDSIWYNPRHKEMTLKKEPTFEIDSLHQLLDIFN